MTKSCLEICMSTQQVSSAGARHWPQTQNLERHGQASQNLLSQGSQNPAPGFSELWLFHKTIVFYRCNQGSENPARGF